MPVNALAVVAFTAAVAQSRAPAPVDSSAHWVHESWTVENGLPVNSIKQLIQSRSGYIWAATFDGLGRFDGVRFTVFNSATSDGLPSKDRDCPRGFDRRNLGRDDEGRRCHPRRPLRASRARDDLRLREIARTAERRQHLGGNGAPRDLPHHSRRPSGQSNARVAADSALDGDIVGRMDEDPDGTLWVAANRGLWRWRERPTRVALPGLDATQPLLVLNMVRSPVAAAMYVQAERGLYRIDSTSVAVVHSLGPFLLGTRLWTDGLAVWYAAGSAVFREAKQTFQYVLRSETG